MTKIAGKTAEDLLDIEAVFLNPNEPFTWASGIRSPVYCDNHITMSHPAVCKEIVEGLVAKIKETLPEVEVIAGAATTETPHAAWVADILGLPVVYIRSKTKDHGKESQIEGQTSEGQKIVVIEDLISAGGSVLETAETAEHEGATVLGVVATFTYELPKGTANSIDEQMTLLTLTNYSTLIDAALEADYIGEKDATLLQERKKDPKNWGK